MENSMGKIVIYNKTEIKNKEALLRIKNFFYENMPHFKLIEELNSENSYNGYMIKYRKQGIIIKMSYSWRGMEHDISIDGKVLSELNFEPKMRDITSCNNINLNSFWLFLNTLQMSNSKSNKIIIKKEK